MIWILAIAFLTAGTIYYLIVRKYGPTDEEFARAFGYSEPEEEEEGD